MLNNEIDVSQRLEQFKQAANAARIKLTPQRLEIFKLVTSSHTHPGADEIFRKLHPIMPSISLDTIYRTLWILKDLGLITTVGIRQESVRFDANLDHHHHFVCTQCGMIGDFTNRKLNQISMPVEACEYGKSISLHVEVRGICDKCLKQNADKTSEQHKIKKE